MQKIQSFKSFEDVPDNKSTPEMSTNQAENIKLLEKQKEIIMNQREEDTNYFSLIKKSKEKDNLMKVSKKAIKKEENRQLRKRPN